MELDKVSQTGSILQHHLQSLGMNQIDEVMKDFTEHSILVSPQRSFHGLAEIRAFFEAMIASNPPGLAEAFQVTYQDIQEELAYIIWKAEPFIKAGTDTYIMQGGKIAIETTFMVI